MTLGKYFLSLAGRGSIFLQEVVEMLEEVVASRQEVRWIWRMRQNFVAQFIQLLKHWLCDVCGEELGPSCWPMAAAGGAFSVHLINLLSIFLRCNGFARIQKAVVNQISSRPQNSDCDLFWCKFGFGKCFGASPQSNYWASHLWFSNKIHFPLHITIWSRNCLLSLHRIKEDNTSKWLFFWFSVRSRGTHLLSFFTFPICFKHLKTVECVEFFSNFSCSSKRISFNDPLNWLLSAYNGWPLCSSSSRLLSPFQHFLNHHCTVYLVC